MEAYEIEIDGLCPAAMHAAVTARACARSRPEAQSGELRAAVSALACRCCRYNGWSFRHGSDADRAVTAAAAAAAAAAPARPASGRLKSQPWRRPELQLRPAGQRPRLLLWEQV